MVVEYGTQASTCDRIRITDSSAAKSSTKRTSQQGYLERVVPPGNDPAEAKLFDINMLVMLGGQERTEREHCRLFETAGFDLTRIIPTRSPLSLIEGTPKARMLQPNSIEEHP